MAASTTEIAMSQTLQTANSDWGFFGTIAQAADRCQVVILTCAPDRFRGIPAAQVERLAHGS